MNLAWDGEYPGSTLRSVMANALKRGFALVHLTDLPRRWLQLATVAAGAGVFILASVLFRNGLKANRDAEEAAALRAHSYEVILNAQQVLSALQDAETGQRGYLLAQKDSYLEPYEQGGRSVQDSLARLAGLTKDNPAQQRRLDAIQSTAGQKLAELSRTLALAKAGDRQAALAIVSTDFGKSLMETARGEIAEFIGEENRLLNLRQEAVARANSNQTYYLIAFTVLGAAVIFVAGAGLLLGALAMTVEKAQAAIEKTGNRLESTFQNAAVGMANLAPDGRYIAVNQRLCCITGFSAAELPGKSFVELTYPEDAAAIAAKMSGMLIGQIASFGLDTRILRKDGSFFWVKSTLGASKAPDGSIDYFIAVIEDISERKRAEESVDTLMHEINHRSKNLLTLVQVIARRTAATNQENFIGRFDERLRALSASQDLLFKSGWPGTTLDALVRSQLAHFRDLVDERITIAGPVLTISAQPAQALGMAIHELATNAGKYGALSNDSGTVAIEWSVHGAPDGQERFRMSWKELGGPPVPLPIGSGFGSTVTTRLVQRSLGGGAGLDFRPSGLIWHLDCPEQNLRDAGMEEAGPAHAAVLS